MNNSEFYNRNFLIEEAKKQEKKQNYFALFFYFFIFIIIIGAAYFFYTDRYQYYFVENDIVVSSGADYQLMIMPKYADNYNSSYFKYKVEDSSIATIDKYGKITALKNGKTNIIVKHKKIIESKKFPISVENISVASVDISSSIADSKTSSNRNKEIYVKKDSTISIKPKINNTNSLKTKIRYRSSDTNIAIVDDFGNLTPINEGKVTITAETEDGIKETVNIVVYADEKEIESLEFSENNITISKNETKKLKLNIKPMGASNKKLTWTSSNTNIVSVDQNGLIKGLKNGNAVIKVRSKNGVTSSIIVYVDSDLSINSTNKTIEIGDSFTLKANKEVSWTSSNPDVASIDSFGVVIGLSEGTAIITAKYNNSSVKCNIKVNKRSIAVTHISLDKSQIKMYVGDVTKVNAIFSPSNATNKKITWSSSNNKLATVDQNGNITAKREGNVVIKAKTNNNLKSELKLEIVKKGNETTNEVINIYLDKSQNDIYINESFKLNYSFSNNISNKNVSWESSNPKVASVDSNGNVKGLSEGTATITVTSSNNSKANCLVKVRKRNIEVSSVSLNKSSVNLYIGESVNLIASVNPSDASNKTLTWSSSNSNVASVDSSGKVTAVGIGNATITVKSNNEKTSTASINVKEKVIETKSITLDKSSVILYVKETVYLNASISPSNATNKSISWSSSNSNVAKVDSNGKVTAVGKGAATITASQGSIQSNCSITIKEPEPTIIEVSEIKMNIEDTIVYAGDTVNLSVTITPSNASNKSVSWKSSNNSIATVDSNGKVKAISPGQAIITAYSGNVKATSIINVREKPTLEKYYSSLDKAIKDANNNVTINANSNLQNAYASVTMKNGEVPLIKLLRDNDRNNSITISNNVILDLNNYKLNITLDDKDYKKAIEISDNKTITIKNGNIDVVFNNTDGSATNPTKGDNLYSIYGTANITKVNLKSTSRKSTYFIYLTGDANINNSNLDFTGTNDGTVGIYSEHNLNIENTTLKVVNKGERPKFTETRGIVYKNKTLIMRNSNIVVDAKYNNMDTSSNPLMTSSGMMTSGNTQLYDTNIKATDYIAVFRNEAKVYIKGGTYKAYGHGIYFANGEGENYIENAKIISGSFSDYNGIGDTSKWITNVLSCMYLGGGKSSTCSNVIVHLNNCTLEDYNAVGGYFVLRGSSGERNLKIYISNTKFIHHKESKFRIDSATDYAYFGKGNTINSNNISDVNVYLKNDATMKNVVFTDEVYTK